MVKQKGENTFCDYVQKPKQMRKAQAAEDAFKIYVDIILIKLYIKKCFSRTKSIRFM